MKKTLLVLLLLFSIGLSAHAETEWFKAYQYAYHLKDKSTGGWQNWSSWNRCDIEVKIDWDNEVITIFGGETMRYEVTQYVDSFEDRKGGRQVKVKIVDQEGVQGVMRLRVEQNGKAQIYLDFAYGTLVYSIEKK